MYIAHYNNTEDKVLPAEVQIKFEDTENRNQSLDFLDDIYAFGEDIKEAKAELKGTLIEIQYKLSKIIEQFDDAEVITVDKDGCIIT